MNIFDSISKEELLHAINNPSTPEQEDLAWLTGASAQEAADPADTYARAERKADLMSRFIGGTRKTNLKAMYG